ncbi:MAG: hypothetical protein U0354_08005 [Candidatus Sericytochromatia bacterium]
MCINKSFKTSRESVGLEPFNPILDNNKFINSIKNNSFKIKECQSFLNLTEEQVRNAIKLNILKSENIGNVLYICIDSVLKLKDNYLLLEQIFNEDELSFSLVVDILGLTKKNVKRLIDEGYLTVLTDKVGNKDFKFIKRGEIKRLIPQIEEVKDFWKKQAKINRQLGVKKTLNIRKNNCEHKSNFKESFFKEIENLPYKESRLIKASFYIVVLNYYITRKLNKNIIDNNLIDLKNKSFKKLLDLYHDNDLINTKYIQGVDTYINYCSSCVKNLKYSSNKDKLDNNNDYCNNCNFDKDYFSTVFINIKIKEYDVNIYISYKDIRDWFDKDKYPCEIELNKDSFKEDNFYINKHSISTNEQKNFKIFEVIKYLNEFIDYKDFDLSINL